LLVVVVLAFLSGGVGGAPPPVTDRTAAGLLWVGDAETGDLSQFLDGPWNDVGGIPPTLVTAPVRDGRYAIALTLTGATDPDAGICCGSRNELVPRFRDVQEGDDLYFGFSTYLAPGFPTSGGWQVITQFKQNFDGSPPLSLNVEERQYELEGGYGHPDGPDEFSRPIGPAITGVWVDWVLHVRFSADPQVGFVEVWQNGVAVLGRFAPHSGTLYPGTGDRAGSYVKTGPYREPTVQVPGTMFLDDWRIGTSYVAVAR
jgi:Polysaccharide lyase